jgi:iron complex transport system substrate-binding protein
MENPLYNPAPPADRDGAVAAAVADARRAGGEVDPQRIVALEWLPVELLLALGVTPYGVADIPNYRLWVNEPALPDSVIDVGLRTEPNLELLTQMKPSFIVWSAGYGPSPRSWRVLRPARIHLQRRQTSAGDGSAVACEMADLLGSRRRSAIWRNLTR